MKDREMRSQDTMPWSISSKKAVRVKANISPKLQGTRQPLLPHQTTEQDQTHAGELWPGWAVCPLTGCRSPPNVQASRCPPCWWTLRQRSGLPTAWRALSGPPVEHRCRGTGSAPGADGQHEPAREEAEIRMTTEMSWYANSVCLWCHSVLVPNRTFSKCLQRGKKWTHWKISEK